MSLLRCLLTYSFCLSLSLPLLSQLEEGSNLPIVVIDAFGVEIPDEPKIDANMAIYYDTTANLNFIDEAYLHFSGFTGIERRGQTSLSLFPKNGFGIETRNQDLSNNNVSIFGWPEENDWVLHGPYSDKTLIRNAMIYTLARGVFDYAPRTQMCELVINGSYEGVYMFTEKIKRDKGRVNISKLRAEDIEGDQLTGGYMVKFDKEDGDKIAWISNFPPRESGFQETRFFMVEPKFEEIIDVQLDYIESFFREFEDVLRSDDFDDPNEGFRKYVDEENLADFILLQELTGNVDSYRLSTYMYKDRDSIDPRFKFGPVWDYNLGFGNANYCQGGNVVGWRWNFNSVCPDDFWVNHFWWKRFLEDDSFVDFMAERWQEKRASVWSDDALIQLVDLLDNQVKAASVRNFQRWQILGEWIWPNSSVFNSHASEIQFLKGWILDRAAWIDGNIENANPVNPNAPGAIELSLSPNPSNGLINISWNQFAFYPERFSLFDGSGRLLFQTEDFNDNDSPLILDIDVPTGIYFYSVEDHDGAFNGKLSIIRE